MLARLTLATALTAALLAITGCGGDTSIADPPVAPPSTSPPPTHPTRRETPEHFIRRWAKIEQRMENTGDTRAYLALSSMCRACRVLAATVARYYKRGGFIHWKGWVVISIRRYPSSSSHIAFSVHSRSNPTTYKTSGGSPVQHLDGGDITYVLTISPRVGPFHIIDKAQLDQR